jgi:hypothetical protein
LAPLNVSASLRSDCFKYLFQKHNLELEDKNRDCEE